MMLGSLKRRRCLEAVSSSYMGISAIQCSWMPGIARIRDMRIAVHGAFVADIQIE